MSYQGGVVRLEEPRRPRSPRVVHSLLTVVLALVLSATAVGAQLPEQILRLPTAPADTLNDSTALGRDTSMTARPSLVSSEAAGVIRRFSSRRDSLEWASARSLARRATGFRLEISMQDRLLWVISGRDTLLTATIAVATGDTLRYAGRVWTFRTPRGEREVLRKREDPVWTPPDWHYAEVAREHALDLRSIETGRPIILSDGSRLEVRNGEVGVVLPGASFAPLPLDEHIVFDSTLFIPPIDSRNRRIQGELGHHMLDLGDGYLLHGTPHTYTIGTAATHGCIRLHDGDIEWLYTFVPLGTKVYLY